MEQLSDLHSFFALVSPVLITIITGYFAYRVGAKKEDRNMQSSLNSGFKILIDELQKERAALSARLTRTIDQGNVELKREMHKRFTEIEARIEHNRANADFNFQIVNEALAGAAAGHRNEMDNKRRKVPIMPKRLPKE